MVSPPCILTAILAGLTKSNIKWAGSSSSTSITHLEMSLFCTDRIKPDTPQPSVCCFSFPSSNSFNFKTTLFEIFMAAATTPMICYASIPPLMPPLIQRSVRRRCRLPLVALSVHLSLHFSLSHTLRSFKSFMPLFESSSTLFSRFRCCITIRFFFAFSLSLLSGLLFYLLSMHMIIPHHSFGLCSIVCAYAPFTYHCLSHSARLVQFRFLSLRSLTVVFVSYFDAHWISAMWRWVSH